MALTVNVCTASKEIVWQGRVMSHVKALGTREDSHQYHVIIRKERPTWLGYMYRLQKSHLIPHPLAWRLGKTNKDGQHFIGMAPQTMNLMN